MKPEEGTPHAEGKPLFIPNSVGIQGNRLQYSHAYNIGGKPHQAHNSRFNDREVEESLQRRIHMITV